MIVESGTAAYVTLQIQNPMQDYRLRGLISCISNGEAGRPVTHTERKRVCV